jgi:hypothetical protein
MLAKRLDSVEVDDILETVHSKEAGYFKREEYLIITSIMSSQSAIKSVWGLFRHLMTSCFMSLNQGPLGRSQMIAFTW